MTKKSYPKIPLNEDALYLRQVVVDVAKDTMRDYVTTYLNQYSVEESLQIQRDWFQEKLGTTDIKEITEKIKAMRVQVREMGNAIMESRLDEDFDKRAIATMEEEQKDKDGETTMFINNLNNYNQLIQQELAANKAIGNYEQQLLDIKRYAMK